jgi:hypothetical protein
MTPVEIEEAISQLALEPFDCEEFAFQFLASFGNKETTLKKLRTGASNASDVDGGVLQRSNVHIATSAAGGVDAALSALRNSPKTVSAKAKFILATDGVEFQAEDLISGETVACRYEDFSDHFGFFLPLAGITTIKEIRESAFDIKATGRLNRLYVQLLKDNPEWASAGRREDMNEFMARLIFCFFAEDTEIIHPAGLFTRTAEQMGASDASDMHVVISEIFRAMDVKHADRETARLPVYAKKFPYVNGALFSGSTDCPRFSKIARSYLLHVGHLDWQKINPDIFGSMIQAVADDEERGALGMHYTSVPNILKVLNPLFLDDLREKLAEAGDNGRKLLNLRNRMARIRVFDPACGSGNFLVIAYKEMRAIEAEINKRRSELERRSDIPLTNFRGIELRDFPAEIARLALIIAEYQCDVTYRGQKEALAEFLPLDSQNWITCGNALRLDWLSICPPTGTTVRIQANDLFEPVDQAEVGFDNEGGETYICGNPPYIGAKWQSADQKVALAKAWAKHPELAKSSDLVTGWIGSFLDYLDAVPNAVAAFVTTNSVCQGEQAARIWPTVFGRGGELRFAHTEFKWSNLASHNAGVTVIVVGLAKAAGGTKRLYSDEIVRECSTIGPYLIPDRPEMVLKSSQPINGMPPMFFGNMPRDGGHLFLSAEEVSEALRLNDAGPFIRGFVGSEEIINGKVRHCIWIDDKDADKAGNIPFLSIRLGRVRENRMESAAASTRDFADRPHRFVQIAGFAKVSSIVVPRVSSEKREYLPVTALNERYIVGDSAFGLYDAPIWTLALVCSKIHIVWITTVCGKLESRFRYSNTLGWNTFPVPTLTDQNRADLTTCAKGILLAREAHFPATIADLYDPEAMPEDLRAAHDRNDEVLERIYIGRRFRNDTERLEKLFELYTKLTGRGEAA